VIGAGIAGLVTARELAKIGYSVIVLESSDRIGGRIMTTDVPIPTSVLINANQQYSPGSRTGPGSAMGEKQYVSKSGSRSKSIKGGKEGGTESAGLSWKQKEALLDISNESRPGTVQDEVSLGPITLHHTIEH
jgi:pyruvate/2-oxoglutarate dehydrogenase complex dihydrolipoamide dehydrogenase (E3) component